MCCIAVGNTNDHLLRPRSAQSFGKGEQLHRVGEHTEFAPALRPHQRHVQITESILEFECLDDGSTVDMETRNIIEHLKNRVTKPLAIMANDGWQGNVR